MLPSTPATADASRSTQTVAKSARPERRFNVAERAAGSIEPDLSGGPIRFALNLPARHAELPQQFDEARDGWRLTREHPATRVFLLEQPSGDPLELGEVRLLGLALDELCPSIAASAARATSGELTSSNNWTPPAPPDV
jgi:hypothetical protein